MKTLEATGSKNASSHRLRVAKGFATLCPICIVHEDEETIVAMQLLGDAERVNASWAALVNGNATHRILSQKVALKGMKQHIRLNKSLPNAEWKETWLIHKQATLEHLDPALDFFYLIGFKPGTPDHFYPMLNKSIGTPTLPTWTAYLWQAGQEDGLIVSNDSDHGVGLNTWCVNANHERWEAIICNGLASADLTF